MYNLQPISSWKWHGHVDEHISKGLGLSSAGAMAFELGKLFESLPKEEDVIGTFARVLTPVFLEIGRIEGFTEEEL